MHVLALDVSDSQAKGAERQGLRQKSPSDQGSFTYRIGNITPGALLRSVDEWIADISPPAVESHPPSVVFVALHACGSLTPDILRTSVSEMRGSNGGNRSWSLNAAIVVGCCYNMMEGKGSSPYYAPGRSHEFPPQISLYLLASQEMGFPYHHRTSSWQHKSR